MCFFWMIDKPGKEPKDSYNIGFLSAINSADSRYRTTNIQRQRLFKKELGYRFPSGAEEQALLVKGQ